MNNSFYIDKNIEVAETLPATFYTDSNIFSNIKDYIFLKTWHLVGDIKEDLEIEGTIKPIYLYDGFLNEPLILVRNYENNYLCLSNVCTHRGNILVNSKSKLKKISCNYHGRQFDLNGKMIYMPEFNKAKNFPTDKDNLISFPIEILNDKFIFISLNPLFSLDSFKKEIQSRLSFLPFNQLILDSAKSRDYLVKANWALYVDNYLEGFHIPWVHPDLNKALDYSSYSTITFDYFNLQIGIGSSGDYCFDLPTGHIDYGKQIAAYYYWLFPNLMLNFYPWGLSINIVKPINVNLTKVSYLTYIYDESKMDIGAGSLLDKVEREDETVVENVQKGVNSRFYNKGRFSPTMEKGVHHFHLLLSKFLNLKEKV